MDETDSQFPAVALLVHDDEVVGAEIASAAIEGHEFGRRLTLQNLSHNQTWLDMIFLAPSRTPRLAAGFYCVFRS